MAREDFAVRGVMPEMDPAEVSPLAVQGFDPSQFGGLGAFGDYRPDFSGAFGGSGSASSLQSAPTSFAVPENYGNPKNKIYQLSAAPGEGVRLKAVDGTVLFEGQGPEAAAKAASIVQELGKQFGTQSTWVLDKQPVGGDWKQVSQDTVGEKKTTAVNAFLNVAAPIAGAFIPGLSPVLGAALGSVANSALQNKNSAQAMKDAAIAAAGTYLGAKIAPSVSGALKGLAPGASVATPIGTLAGNAVEKSLAAAAEQAAARAALSQGIATTIIPMVTKQGLTSAIAPSIGAAISGLVRPNFNPKLDTTVPKQDLAAKPNEVTTPNDAELVVTGTRLAPGFDPSIAGAGLGAGLGGIIKPDFNPTLDTTVPTTDPVIDELVVTAKPRPTIVEPLITAGVTGLTALRPTDLSDVVKPDFNPDLNTDVKGPLDVVKDVLPYVAPLVGGVTGGSGGSGGSGGNTLSYPGGGQPGTSGSLGGIFTSKLPTPTGLAVTPRDMGQRDWLRYGMGPEASFFSNVPDRQAPLAVTPTTTHALAPQNNPLAAMPALAEKLSEPSPNLMVKPDTQTASVPADGTMLNGNPSIVWNGGINGGWMQTERGMPPPEAFARGGSTGGTSHKPRTEFAVHGAGTGRSDDIPAVLSDGEYVMDAETVALLGDGSSKAGAEKLDQLRVNLRRHKGANLAKGRFSVNAKSPEKYLAGGRV